MVNEQKIERDMQREMKKGLKWYNKHFQGTDDELWNDLIKSSIKFENKMKLFNRLKDEGNLKLQTRLDKYI